MREIWFGVEKKGKRISRRVEFQAFGHEVERILRHTLAESLMGFHSLRFSAV